MSQEEMAKSLNGFDSAGTAKSVLSMLPRSDVRMSWQRWRDEDVIPAFDESRLYTACIDALAAVMGAADALKADFQRTHTGGCQEPDCEGPGQFVLSLRSRDASGHLPDEYCPVFRCSFSPAGEATHVELQLDLLNMLLEGWNEGIDERLLVFGRTIKALRRRQGLTRRQLAQRLNRSDFWVTMMESGLTPVADISEATIESLANALNADAELLKQLLMDREDEA